MALQTLEGTWEEILDHADELAGHRVRVTVLRENGVAPDEETLPERNREILAAYEEWCSMEWTEEEKATLDGMEQFIKEHPFHIRQIEDKP